MGQATVDLPDPMEPPATVANTDDLLAQLAGEEIDRLLAENDSAGDESSQAEAVAPVAPAAEGASAAKAAPANANSTVDAQLGDLFASLGIDGTSPETHPGPSLAGGTTGSEANSFASAATPSAPLTDDAAAKSAADSDLAEDATSAAERGALDASEVMPAPPAAASRPTVTARQHRPEFPPILLPVRWLSAPLDGFSDDVRDTIGKIAILTTVNAVAILVYVLFVRGH